MKILITEEQIHNLIPPTVKRRVTSKDFQILDDIIHTNKKYDLNNPFNKYLDINLRDSLHELIQYKVSEINPNLGDDAFEYEESLLYKIFSGLIPFLKKKYHDDLYDYYVEHHRGRGNINESSINRTKQMILDSFDKIDYIKTIKKFNLWPEALDKIFPKGISEIGNIDDYCDILEDLIKAFFRIGYLKGKSLIEYNGKSYEFRFDISPHMGSLMVDIFDLDYKDTIGVYATPFYEGNCGLPIDVDIYVPDEEEGGIQPSKHIDYYVDLDEKNFKTFSDITNWFNNDYPYIILKEINPLWNKFRNGMF